VEISGAIQHVPHLAHSIFMEIEYFFKNIIENIVPKTLKNKRNDW